MIERCPVTAVSLAGWLLILAGVWLAACDKQPSLVERVVQGDELRNATTPAATLPAGCSTLTISIPAGKKDVTISYQEPTADQTGSPLTNLSHTTIYLGAANSQGQSIRIQAADPRGGAYIKIHHVVPPAQEFRLCATATNRAGKESIPTSFSAGR